MNTNKKLWFRRKTYGWGWTPCSWQGWVITLLYVALVIVFSMTLDEASSDKEAVFTFFLPVALLTITLIRICYKKGESPKWQWGRKK